MARLGFTQNAGAAEADPDLHKKPAVQLVQSDGPWPCVVARGMKKRGSSAWIRPRA